ncbi:hypothetical protein K432DRAFT_426571 [Lepidopterella palustris CBS 459.81]|uniref:CFEM domain-containing protein n=1 Tax=Lepidopterella palustris CBS 459.81 TaxID=1314670 RepID=A0A8E2E8S8_9PEZI|nr:hypothetical protein K432DRAFT_426571 [Lepidopterella palustris CBS 459.81]
MLFSHLKRLCIIGPSLIAALPQQPTSTTTLPTTLPVPLQSSVPACAQSCMVSSLYNEFPLSCASSGDLNCLCSRYSTTGQSLGEVALGCVYASCSSVESSASAAYNICLGQNNAVPPTQSALTVTALRTTLSTITETPTPSPIAHITSSTISSSTPPASVHPAAFSTISSASTPSSVFSPSVMVSSSASARPSTAFSGGNSTAQAQESKPLNTAQIIGISIAGSATVILAAGVMIISICMRRRHEQHLEHKERRRTEKKELNPLHPQPTNPAVPQTREVRDPRGVRGGAGVGVGVMPVQRVEGTSAYENTYANPSATALTAMYPLYPAPNQAPKVASSRLRSQKYDAPRLGSTQPGVSQDAAEARGWPNPVVPLEEIGVAISPETEHHASPESAVSTRTLSRLLPDKPVPILRDPTPRFQTRPESRSQRPESAMTTVTLFEEDTPIDRRKSFRVATQPPAPIPPFKKFKSQRPEQPPYPAPLFSQNYTTSPESTSQPVLSLDIPVRHSRYQRSQIPSPIRESASTRASSNYDRPLTSTPNSSSLDMSHGGYIPDYYISPDKLFSRNEKFVPKLVQIKAKSSSSNISRATSVTSRSRRDSGASNTSFETAGPSDPTPEYEDEDKQLSPVAESPISNLRYPKVPRASNQAVSRSPKSPRSSRGTQAPPSPAPSLLVKRRGEQQAHDLESRFWITESHGKSIRRDGGKGQHARGSSDGLPADSSRGPAQRMVPNNHRRSKSLTVIDMEPLEYPLRSADVEALRSPLWLPRLTPTRHGDDLFISVT